jgi:hypothetical protein
MQNVEGGGSLTWEPSWPEVDAERGAMWTVDVDPGGRGSWGQVVADRGPRWAPDDGRTPNRDMEGHEALAWSPNNGRPNWAGLDVHIALEDGRSWTRVNWAPIRCGHKRAETAKSDINLL